jgi:putative oxidoreductase
VQAPPRLAIALRQRQREEGKKVQLHQPDPGAPTSTTRVNTLHYAPYVRSVVRIIVALLFFEHGLSKMAGFPVTHAPMALFSLGWFSGAIEFAGGALLAVGLFSRFAAFVMSGEMAFAYFMSHAPRGFFPMANGGEAAILFCFIFLYLAFAGPGPWSLDALMRRR